MSLSRNDVRSLACEALLQLLEPLAGFSIDAGLSASDVNALLREAYVRSVANRQLETYNRVNISGVAATTGISRAEISRILKQKIGKERRPSDRRQQSTNRILSAWHSEPRFHDAHGQPAELKLYGRGATFEALVKVYGRGIPTRAVLDELVRLRVVEVLPGQRIRAKASVAVHGALSRQVIKEFGSRAAVLLSTMLTNIRDPENARFIATASTATPKFLSLIRRELSTKSSEFLSEVQRTRALGPQQKSSAAVLGITVFCHEQTRKNSALKSRLENRKNFRRRPARSLDADR